MMQKRALNDPLSRPGGVSPSMPVRASIRLLRLPQSGIAPA